MTIIEICLIIITVILVLRNFIGIVIAIGLYKKIKPLIDQSLQVVSQLQDTARYIKEETLHIKDTIHGITQDTKAKFNTFKDLLETTTRSLHTLNSIIKAIVSSVNYFFKEKEK